MAKRRQKKRTHVRISEEELAKIPRSMVIHLNDTLRNHSITQLVRDFRNMMQPHTAINLRERKSNKLKDFVVMAGPLGVTQLFLFSQNETSGSTNLRVSSMPRGPTLTFNIQEYSLGKDISRILKNPKSVSKISSEFINPPLLVMNGFNNPKDAEPHEKLVITMFQNMFPPINPQVTKVNTIKRVLLLNKDPETGIIDLRHYIIDTKLVDVSKSVKRLINIRKNFNKKLPNLSKVKDVADIVLDPYSNGAANFTSDSEVEDDAIVEVEGENEILTKPKVKKDSNSDATSESTSDTKRKRAVKLTEIGPRLKLNLIKIEDGVCAGKVMYHSRITKSSKEINLLDQKHAVRKKQKLARQKEQEANIAKKKEKKLAKKARRAEAKARRENGEIVESSDEDDSDSSDSDSEEEDEEEKLVEAGIHSDGDLFDVDDYETEE